MCVSFRNCSVMCNTGEGVSLEFFAEQATVQITRMLARMNELSV